MCLNLCRDRTIIIHLGFLIFDPSEFFFFVCVCVWRENDSRLYSIKSLCTMRKRKEGHFSNQIMTFLFSFAALAKANTARLHRKGIL